MASKERSPSKHHQAMVCQTQTLTGRDSHAMRQGRVWKKHQLTRRPNQQLLCAMVMKRDSASSSNQTHFVGLASKRLGSLESPRTKKKIGTLVATSAVFALITAAFCCLKPKLTGPLVKLSAHQVVRACARYDALSAPPSLHISILEDPSSYRTSFRRTREIATGTDNANNDATVLP